MITAPLACRRAGSRPPPGASIRFTMSKTRPFKRDAPANIVRFDSPPRLFFEGAASRRHEAAVLVVEARLAHRQHEADRGAEARLALDLQHPAVHLHQRFGERQAQPRALLGLRLLAFDLLERPRQADEVLGRDADAGVANADLDALAHRVA